MFTRCVIDMCDGYYTFLYPAIKSLKCKSPFWFNSNIFFNFKKQLISRNDFLLMFKISYFLKLYYLIILNMKLEHLLIYLLREWRRN
jgi:hypothetical protein